MLSVSATIWLTGLPSAGKTTLGEGLRHYLQARAIAPIMLDGDDVRRTICSDLGFSESDRTENIRRASSVARLLNDQGFVVICCFVSPLAAMRSMAKSIVGDCKFFEVFVDADIKTCTARDVKGLYSKALQGAMGNLTGISAPYEKPLNPNLSINTDSCGQGKSIEVLCANVDRWLNIEKNLHGA